MRFLRRKRTTDIGRAVYKAEYNKVYNKERLAALRTKARADARAKLKVGDRKSQFAKAAKKWATTPPKKKKMDFSDLI